MHRDPNQSPVAARKLKRLARTAGLPVELVRFLASTIYDFDPVGRESRGWIGGRASIRDDDVPDEARPLFARLPTALSRDAATQAVLEALASHDGPTLWRALQRAGASGSYRHLSPFATAHYLRNASRERLATLSWPDAPIRREDLVRFLFLKVFRGGSVDRDQLLYAYADLVVPLPDTPPPPPSPWVHELASDLAQAPPAKLSDLIACARRHTKGDKYFRQTLLEALSYAGVLRVEGYESSTFWPEHGAALARHFYSNEWTVPLRFWAERGRHVDPSVVPVDL